MKKLQIIIVLVAFSLCQSCSKNNTTSNTVTEQISNNMKQGNWVITNFSENNITKTSIFTNYSFAFEDNNIALCTHLQSKNIFNGTWSLLRDSSGDDDDDDDDDHGNSHNTTQTNTNANTINGIDNLRLIFNYNYNNELSNLNKKWIISSYSGTKIELVAYNNLNLLAYSLTIEVK